MFACPPPPPRFHFLLYVFAFDGERIIFIRYHKHMSTDQYASDEWGNNNAPQSLYLSGWQSGKDKSNPVLLDGAVKPIGHHVVPLGVGGKPQATPVFCLAGEDAIRHEHACCGYGPGPNIPLHWYDGGEGWVTKYFYNSTPRDPKTYEPGKFRCQAPSVERSGELCNHEVSETDCCKGNACWWSNCVAYRAMGTHLQVTHHQVRPPKRPWTSGLFDTEGCLEAFFCAPCQGSRQVMALAGWEDRFHWGWCLLFTFLGLRSEEHGDRRLYWVPPCLYVALLTRHRMTALGNIDEHMCKTWLIAIFCSVCSIAQTYRELSGSGVWSGTNCGQQRPQNYGSIVQPTAGVAPSMV